LQHHFEPVVPAADIYVRGARLQVVAVSVCVSLSLQLKIDLIQSPAEGKRKEDHYPRLTLYGGQ